MRFNKSISTTIAGSAICFAILFWAMSPKAESQLGTLKASVALQGANPGFSQSGNANISGAMRAGSFIGNGSGLTNLPSNELVFPIFRSQVYDFTLSGLINITNTSTSTGAVAISGHSNSITGAGISGTAGGSPTGWPTTPAGVLGRSDTGHGVAGFSLDSTGVFGSGNVGVYGLSADANGIGLMASAHGSGGIAIDAIADAVSGSSRALRATSGLNGQPTVEVVNNGAAGFADGVSSLATSSSAAAVWARNTATSGTGFGVLSTTASPDGNAVRGEALVSGGVGYGVFGGALSSGWGLWANGRSGASGTKSFRIDHPLDPENKYLLHYSSEGPEPLNIYSGVSVTGKDGFSWIALPDYFGSINRDPRVQLTVHDSSDDFVMAKVVGEIESSGFRIRTSKPNVKVYWEVKAVRNDAYVSRYGAPVEVDKLEHERGRYLHPELYGESAQRGMFYSGREQSQHSRKRRP